jgi:hypothetical protein
MDAKFPERVKCDGCGSDAKLSGVQYIYGKSPDPESSVPFRLQKALYTVNCDKCGERHQPVQSALTGLEGVDRIDNRVEVMS